MIATQTTPNYHPVYQYQVTQCYAAQSSILKEFHGEHNLMHNKKLHLSIHPTNQTTSVLIKLMTTSQPRPTCSAYSASHGQSPSAEL